VVHQKQGGGFVKKLVGGIIVAVVGLSVLGALTGDEAGSPSRATSASATYRVGDTARVGDIDLTLVRVDQSFDSAVYNRFNDANVAVTMRVVNARGDDYTFSPGLALKLVDSSGIAHDPDLCTGCPGERGSVDMVRGGRFETVVYFTAPAGRLTELRYEPFLSTNKVSFRLAP
jgi:hypothetical protein